MKNHEPTVNQAISLFSRAAEIESNLDSVNKYAEFANRNRKISKSSKNGFVAATAATNAVFWEIKAKDACKTAVDLRLEAESARKQINADIKIGVKNKSIDKQEYCALLTALSFAKDAHERLIKMSTRVEKIAASVNSGDLNE
jgi:hypothetical protein